MSKRPLLDPEATVGAAAGEMDGEGPEAEDANHAALDSGEGAPVGVDHRQQLVAPAQAERLGQQPARDRRQGRLRGPVDHPAGAGAAERQAGGGDPLGQRGLDAADPRPVAPELQHRPCRGRRLSGGNAGTRQPAWRGHPGLGEPGGGSGLCHGRSLTVMLRPRFSTPTRPVPPGPTPGARRAGRAGPASSSTAMPSSLRLGELRAGLGAGDDPVGLLRHRAGDLAAERFDHLLGVVAGQRRQRAGEDEGLAGERQRAPPTPALALLPGDAGAAQARHHLEVVRLVEEGVDALGDDRADVGDLEQLLDARRHQPVEVAEVPRQVLGSRLADVADAEGVEEARQRRLRARRDAARPACRRSSRPCARGPRAAPASGRRGRAASSPARRRPAGRRSCRPGLRCRARVGRRSAGSRSCAARRRTGRRCSGGRRRPPRAPPRCRTPDSRAACGSSARSAARRGRRSAPTTSGITSPARRTITVSPTRTPLRRISNRLCSVAFDTVVPPTNTGSSLATGVSLPVRPTWMSMRVQQRRLLLRRILLRHGPARLARLEAELVLQGPVVDLVDDAVDVVRQAVAHGRDRGVEVDQPGRALAPAGASGSPAGRSRRRPRAGRSGSAARSSRRPRRGRRRRS